MAKAQTKATNKYQAKAYDRLAIVVPKGERKIIKEYAAKHDISVNALIYDYLKSIIPELNND